MFIVETSRFNFVSQDAESGITEDGYPIIQSLNWTDYLQDVLNAGGQFIELRRLENYQELTVAYRLGGPVAQTEFISNGTQYVAPPPFQSIDELINGSSSFPFG